MMEWPEATHYKERVSLTPAEISRAFATNELHLMAAVEAFISSTEPSTFESLLAQLSDRLRTEVTIYARDGVLHFDETIQTLEKAGDYTLGWVAYRDWAMRQPWLPEALLEAKAREDRWQRWEAQRAQRESLSEQGWILADLRVRIFRASTPEERAALEAEAKRLEAEFTALNRGPSDA